MGCDIHLHIEVKITGEWRHWAQPDVQRDYMLFAKMADIRNNYGITPIAQPKGMPEKVSFVTDFECKRWDVDGHAHSWLDISEIKQLAEYVENELAKEYSQDWYSFEYHTLRGSYLCGNPYAGILEYPSNYPKEIEDVRFIFWFDN